MGEFFDHPNKITIRDSWCKPIIRGISNHLSKKLVYLGLPGLDAIDITTWLEYIKFIIAFDCGDYNQQNFNIAIAREKIGKLGGILNSLERRGDIDGYSLYLGFIEEVILKGIDKNGQTFGIHDTINIYNLDFCNSLTLPLKIVDLNGEISTYYKNEVIRKLLELERDLPRPDASKQFLMFITVHISIFEEEAVRYLENRLDAPFKDYSQLINNLRPTDKKAFLLRFYFLDILLQQFTTTGFTPYFFPTILYQGLGRNKLMCFTVVGKYAKLPSAGAPFNQGFNNLIKEKFLSPNHGRMGIISSAIATLDPSSDPVFHLENSPLFI